MLIAWKSIKFNSAYYKIINYQGIYQEIRTLVNVYSLNYFSLLSKFVKEFMVGPNDFVLIFSFMSGRLNHREISDTVAIKTREKTSGRKEYVLDTEIAL